MSGLFFLIENFSPKETRSKAQHKAKKPIKTTKNKQKQQSKGPSYRQEMKQTISAEHLLSLPN